MCPKVGATGRNGVWFVLHRMVNTARKHNQPETGKSFLVRFWRTGKTGTAVYRLSEPLLLDGANTLRGEFQPYFRGLTATAWPVCLKYDEEQAFLACTGHQRIAVHDLGNTVGPNLLTI